MITLAEYEASQLEEEKQEDLYLIEGMEEVVEEADKGELFILRRALSGLKSHEDEQSENIFHSTCTVKGKVCTLIIDIGTDVASISMVGTLNPQAMAHPHPYNF